MGTSKPASLSSCRMCDYELQKETDEKEVVYLPQLKLSSHVFLLQMSTFVNTSLD